jgi:hypothetical protein
MNSANKKIVPPAKAFDFAACREATSGKSEHQLIAADFIGFKGNNF